MKEADLAYTAGIVDGEGSISIRCAKNKHHTRGYQLEMVVGVVNTNEWLCQWLKFAYGGTVCLQTGSRLGKKPVWQWTISARQAGNFLNLVLPYLRLKHPQAELAITFQKNKKHSGRQFTDEEWALQQAQRFLLQRINRGGL